MKLFSIKTSSARRGPPRVDLSFDAPIHYEQHAPRHSSGQAPGLSKVQDRPRRPGNCMGEREFDCVGMSPPLDHPVRLRQCGRGGHDPMSVLHDTRATSERSLPRRCDGHARPSKVLGNATASASSGGESVVRSILNAAALARHKRRPPSRISPQCKLHRSIRPLPTLRQRMAS